MRKIRCAGQVWYGLRECQCPLPGELEYNKMAWCHEHHPPTVKVKDDEQLAKLEERRARREQLRKEHAQKQLAARALDWMRNEQPDVVAKWEEELNA